MHLSCLFFLIDRYLICVCVCIYIYAGGRAKLRGAEAEVRERGLVLSRA